MIYLADSILITAINYKQFFNQNKIDAKIVVETTITGGLPKPKTVQVSRFIF